MPPHRRTRRRVRSLSHSVWPFFYLFYGACSKSPAVDADDVRLKAVMAFIEEEGKVVEGRPPDPPPNPNLAYPRSPESR